MQEAVTSDQDESTVHVEPANPIPEDSEFAKTITKIKAQMGIKEEEPQKEEATAEPKEEKVEAKPKEEVEAKPKEEVKTEEAKEPEKTETTKEERRKFAEITRLRQENLRVQRELKEAREAQKRWDEEKAALTEKSGKFEQFRKLAEENPSQFLQEAGLSYKDLTERLVKDGDKTPEEIELLQMKQHVAKIEQAYLDLKNSLDEEKQTASKAQEEAEYKEKVENFYQQRRDYMSATEGLEFSKHFGEGSVQHVVDIMGKVLQDSGKRLSDEEAFSMVEDAYVADIEPLLDLPKMQKLIESKFGISLSGTHGNEPAQSVKKEDPITTLTNDMARAPKLSEDEDDDLGLTFEERLKKVKAKYF